MTLFKQVNYTLLGLINYIENGDIGLPEIQRPFVWGNSKVRDLFDSMYKGFPVGYLLFWANGSSGNRQIGSNIKQKIPNLLIVDGQQRLTSLYAVMKGMEILREDYKKEKILIAFNPISETFEVSDAANQKNPEFINDISQIWSAENDMFTLVEEYLSRLKKDRDLGFEEEKAIKKAINKLDNIHNYPFTALEVSSSANEEQVAEIFVRVNSKGMALNQADFILTLMSVFWDEGRTLLESFCRSTRIPSENKPSPYNHFFKPDPSQLLRVNVAVGFRRARLNYAYLILRGKDLETEEFSDERRTAQFEVLQEAQEKVLNLQNWHEFLKIVQKSGYINNSMMTSQNAFLYAYALFLIGKYDFKVDHQALRTIMARWYFMINMTSRYSGSFESTMEQDMNRLRDVSTSQGFINTLDQIIQDELTEDFWKITFPNELATSSSRTPSLFAYHAALVNLNAPVLFSSLSVRELADPAIKSTKSSLERHHLYPKAFLKTIGINEIRDTNQIANFALVEWNDNIDISDTPPSVYFKEYENRYNENEWKKIYFLHALWKGWENTPYEAFLLKRRQLMAEVVKKGFLAIN